MRKIIAVLLALTFLLAFAACGKAAVKDDADRGSIAVKLNGSDLAGAKTITTVDFQKATETKTIGDTTYYGKSLSALFPDEISKVNVAFTKSDDGYAAYFADAKDLFIATYKVEGDEYISLADRKGDAASFTAVTENGKAKAVTELYLFSDAQDWSVPVNINGEEKTVTIDDFMAMNPQYMTLGHKYNGGADYFEGEFLAVDSKTFWETLGVELTEGKNDETDEDGNPLPVFYVPDMDLNITGYVQSSSSSMKLKLNRDLSPNPLKEKTGWLVYYFVMIDGNDHHEIEGLDAMDLDLSCIFSGTGIRWMTTPITQIDIVPHVEVEE